MLSDTTGREEALLLPEAILQAWQYKRALQSQADRCLEQTKALLQNHHEQSQLPLTAQSLLARLEAVRAPGLWRLLQMVEGSNAAPDILGLLRAWADRSTKILREARGLERRFLGHRDWFYHNLARDLCRRYQQITIDVVSPEGAATGTTPNASSYRHLLAPSRFVTFLRQAAGETGTTVTTPQAAFHSESAWTQTVLRDPVQRGES
jgi:hypothetical protein